MSKQTGALSRVKIPLILFVAAAILLIVSAVGTTQAALTYFSDPYVARLSMSNIGVSLVENDSKVVAWRNYEGNDNWNEGSAALLTNVLPQGETLQLGKKYPEALSVRNTGTIGEYVRVSIQKYWIDAQGNKVQALSPDLIDLHFLTNNGWMIDSSSTTAERTVLYFNAALQPGESTPPLCDYLSISPAISSKATQTTKETVGEDGKVYTTITTTYDYDGMLFSIEATVDAVQDHNIVDGAKSAWGISVSVNDGILSLR